MNISVIGTGYVGLVTGACLADYGMNVLCADIDKDKVSGLEKGNIPIYEPGLNEIVRRNRESGNLSFTADIKSAVEHATVIFIAVGTPALENGAADLRQVFAVVDDIAGFMQEYKLIINKSTVPVGTGMTVKTRIEDRLSRLDKSTDFDVASNPEFVREGSAVKDFIKPDRVVIGSESEKAADILKQIYEPQIMLGIPCIFTSIETAEMIKYASNAFLATKISYMNEIANICELCGADISVVSKVMGLDRRIGPLYLNPGPGFGGSCLTKDLQALCNISEGRGYVPKVAKSVLEANIMQKKRVFEKIKKCLGGIEKKTVTILGLAFKPGTDDIRDAPAIDIIRALSAEKAHIKAYDPKAMSRASQELSPIDVQYCKGVYSACRNSDCIVLLTDWNTFKKIDFLRLKTVVNTPILIDMRNIFDPGQAKSAGFVYHGIGRK